MDWNAVGRAECHYRLFRQCTEGSLAFEKTGSSVINPQWGMARKKAPGRRISAASSTVGASRTHFVLLLSTFLRHRPPSHASKYTRGLTSIHASKRPSVERFKGWKIFPLRCFFVAKKVPLAKCVQRRVPPPNGTRSAVDSLWVGSLM